MPEIGLQIALNLQMVELQFDGRNASRKIALNVIIAHIQTRDTATLTLRFDNHMHPLFWFEKDRLGSFAYEGPADLGSRSSISRAQLAAGTRTVFL
jgi:hypothetical protein